MTLTFNNYITNSKEHRLTFIHGKFLRFNQFLTFIKGSKFIQNRHEILFLTKWTIVTLTFKNNVKDSKEHRLTFMHAKFLRCTEFLIFVTGSDTLQKRHEIFYFLTNSTTVTLTFSNYIKNSKEHMLTFIHAKFLRCTELLTFVTGSNNLQKRHGILFF